MSLIRFENPAQVAAKDRARAVNAQETARKVGILPEAEDDGTRSIDLSDVSAFTTRLGSVIAKDWQRNRDNKTRVERSMLECLREKKGQYSPQELADIEATGQSDIYVKEVTSKIRAGTAHAKAILLPEGARAHGINPTPIADLPPYAEDAIVQRIAENPYAVDEQGQPLDPSQQAETLEAMVRRAFAKQAKEACRKMEKRINDQLAEGGWQKAVSDLIEDFFTYPCAFFKGPFFVNKPKLKWERGSDGRWSSVVRMEPTVSFRTINPFDAYPGPGVDSVQKGAFIERLRLSKGDLFKMIGMPGYNEEAIRAVLEDAKHQGNNEWLWTDQQRQYLAEHQYFWYASTTEIDGLHWYGRAQGIDLVEWGMNPDEVPDLLDEYEVDAILIGRHVIRATLNADPLFRRPVQAASYDPIPGTLFGNCPPTLMRSTTKMMNAITRALATNLAHAAGFQVEIDYERISDETDPFDIHPQKVWQFKESTFSGDRPGVRFFQPSSNAQELLALLEYWKRVASNDTGIPEFLHGGSGGDEQGADATARGRAMLMDQSAKLLRAAIMQLDINIIQPVIEMLYTFNMRFDPDESIKGDAQVVARGANAMLQRESARTSNMALIEMLAANPTAQMLAGLEGQAYLWKNLVNTFDTIDADQVIPEDDELEDRIRAMESAPPPPDPQIVKAEMDVAQNAEKMMLEREKLAEAREAREQKARADRATAIMESRTRELVAKTQAEADVRRGEMEAQQRSASNMRDNTTLMNRERFRAEQDARRAVIESRVEKLQQVPSQAFTQEDIREAVEGAVLLHIGSLKDDTLQAIHDISERIIGDASRTPTASDPASVINLNVEMCQPGAKTIRATRDAQGNLVGTVTPGATPDAGV